MIVQSVQCDNCWKIMKIDYDDYFELSGSIKRGIRYSLNSKDDRVSHICVNCFIKHFNLMVSTTREPLNIEKQGDILKRKIEDTPIPPWEDTCTGPSKDDPYPNQVQRFPTKNDPYPHNGRFN